MTKLIGWIFFLMCPFVGGSLLLFMGLSYILCNAEIFYIGFTIWCLIWIILFITWFDGSKYQRVL